MHVQGIANTSCKLGIKWNFLTPKTTKIATQILPNRVKTHIQLGKYHGKPKHNTIRANLAYGIGENFNRAKPIGRKL